MVRSRRSQVARSRSDGRRSSTTIRGMIAGAHTIIFAEDAERARAFLRDVLGLDGVDAGDGWLIFALPPARSRSTLGPDGAAGRGITPCSSCAMTSSGRLRR